MNFEHQVVLVTGGASGIGAAVAAGFARAGAEVVIGDVSLDQAERLASGLRDAGVRAYASGVDVTDAAALDACVQTIVTERGGLDHLVACAGLATRHTIPQMSAEVWRRVVDVNLTGAFLAIKAAEPAMAERGGGSVTLISSIAAEHIAYLSGVHYAASKSAHIGLVRHAAFELGGRVSESTPSAPGP